MEERSYETNPITARIVGISAVGGVGFLAGALLLAMGPDEYRWIAISILVFTALAEMFLIFRAVTRFDCHECHEQLQRVPGSTFNELKFDCTRCDIRWKIPTMH